MANRQPLYIYLKCHSDCQHDRYGTKHWMTIIIGGYAYILYILVKNYLNNFKTQK
jgi:hypothetical protein